MDAQTASYQVTKRQMTDAEQKSVRKIYKNAQKQARPAGVFAIVFALIGMFSGDGSLDFSTSKGMISVMVLVVGIFAFAYGMSISRLRKNVADAIDNGSVVIVRGTVTSYSGRGKTSAIVVGPLSLGLGKENANRVREGMVAEVACVPKLRSVVSINGVGLENPIKLVIPADLETKITYQQPQSAAPATFMPAPAATQSPEAKAFCPSCGQKGNGLAFCSNCGNKL